MTRRPITATYRLQLRGPEADPSGRAFGFAEAEAVVPYLAELGVSHLYLSPILTAPAHSTHSYDVTDPTEINPAFGGIAGLRSLADTARGHGLGIIIDIVPNHLGVDDPRENPWWWDVLKFGRDSEYESYFDIDWHDDNGAGGKLGLPVLGAEGDEDKLTLDEVDGETVLRYYDNVFPVRPGTGDAGDPAAVHDAQSYRLMYWKSGIIGYRRFFSVNGLAGVRQEDPVVFEHTHRVLSRLIAEDLIDGVRVDHPDGLSDPFSYLGRLRALIGDDRWLVVEKILGVDEPLDPRLAVDGTTGYDALRELDGVFISREAEDALSMLAMQQSGSAWDEAAVTATEQALKRSVAADELAAEVRRLARAVRRDNFSTAGDGVSERMLTDTIIELVAAMPVYRADYISLSRVTASVVAEMTRRFPSRRDALDLITAGLLADGEAAVRFAQVCGAVMAKGVEDTTFYRACRLVALQEVGGAPGRFGVGPAEFHLLQQERSVLWPRTMTTLSTHDTKRGEDVRARIIEVTDAPGDFAEMVREVTAITPPPDGATGHFLLQNLIGVWPADGEMTDAVRERFHAYATKAVREAGVHTTWTDVDEGFEQSVSDWIDALCSGPATERIAAYVGPIAAAAVQITLGRKLLQLIGPGIPDVYQGTEFLDDSLVDPDNRRFVDYTARSQTLSLLSTAPDPVAAVCESAVAAGVAVPAHVAGDDLEITPEEAGETYPHLRVRADMAKQAVVHAALKVRREEPASFVGGDYQAVFAVGPAESHVVGIARGPEQRDVHVIALAVRRPLRLAASGGWRHTTISLPEGVWKDRLTGRTFSGAQEAADLFALLPAALLVRVDGES
ncbi:malto-oligosyltrehalose synthase [Corynebacterium sp. P7003]|uniref:Malto-oligosyltrehalose synthase n=1 Tax=Corynebacterium pygosceleis TaxID=2800406 RepID=A0ABT3WRY6_9CORY|nr:malto-oligosyltrehalose synthase [Corynebacterium pygosceleis]MCX7444084.1 malto-oligosyltrehalose synthase [Corynebacterium pygosceleis]